MIFFDCHCDTLTKIMEVNANIMSNTCHIDVDRMKKYDGYVQVMAAFIDPAYGQAYAMKRAVQIIDKFYEQLDLYKDHMLSMLFTSKLL